MGTPGLLFIQAKILIKGVEDLSNLHERSITELAGFEVQDDGSIVADKARERIREDGKDPEYRMIRHVMLQIEMDFCVALISYKLGSPKGGVHVKEA